MKLALVRRRFTQSGGAENYTARLAEGLCAAGYDVHLVCESWKKESPITTPYTVCELGPTGSPSAFADLADAFFANHPFDFVFSLERIHRCDLYRAGDGVHQKWLSIKNEGRRFAAFLDGLNPKHRQILLLEKELLARKGARHIIANSQTGAEEIQSLYGRSA
ncbi:MAG: glycosyltransferase family 4 protein, partial [Verrucomicrobiae bacterium]|nr:glycosyltransferase family 4 protein [Verrucomicrobiae bacterium]